MDKYECTNGDNIPDSHGKVAEYDIVRALLMILVILGHCTYYQISTNYGGAYYQDLMLQAGVNDTIIHRITSWVTGAIYTFHMPLFMALSGAVLDRKSVV